MPRNGHTGAVSDAAPAELTARWEALWRRLGLPGDGAAELRSIAGRYAEPARHYHTLDHVADCLETFDRHRDLAERPDEVELALWLHDVVYDPRRSDNETTSAAVAERMLDDAGLASDVHRRIGEMIELTAHTGGPPKAPDAALVCDVDLAILGASPGRYADYARRIAAEYAWVPGPIFRQRRAAILRRFLARGSIYATEPFRRRCEAAARRNLSAELAELGH